MVKCALCSKNVEKTFLDKPMGTYVKNAKGKRQVVCRACQKTLSLEQIRAKL